MIEESSTDVTRTVSYAEIAAKGPKQTPEEVSTAPLASPTIIPHLVLHARLYVRAKPQTWTGMPPKSR